MNILTIIDNISISKTLCIFQVQTKDSGSPQAVAKAPMVDSLISAKKSRLFGNKVDLSSSNSLNKIAKQDPSEEKQEEMASGKLRGSKSSYAISNDAKKPTGQLQESSENNGDSKSALGKEG